MVAFFYNYIAIIMMLLALGVAIYFAYPFSVLSYALPVLP